jgi:hypothetical protein
MSEIVIVNGVVELHCPDHFPAKLETKQIDDDGMALMICPAGHTIIEET